MPTKGRACLLRHLLPHKAKHTSRRANKDVGTGVLSITKKDKKTCSCTRAAFSMSLSVAIGVPP